MRIKENITVGLGLDVTSITAAGTTTVDGAAFDMRNKERAIVLVDVGAWTTDGSLAVHVEESATGTNGWSDASVEVAKVAGSPSGASGNSVVIDSADDDDQTFAIEYGGGAAFMRCSLAVTGQTTGSLASVVMYYVGESEYMPT